MSCRELSRFIGWFGRVHKPSVLNAVWSECREAASRGFKNQRQIPGQNSGKYRAFPRVNALSGRFNLKLPLLQVIVEKAEKSEIPDIDKKK